MMHKQVLQVVWNCCSESLDHALLETLPGVSVLDSSSSCTIKSTVKCVFNYQKNCHQFPTIVMSPPSQVVCRCQYMIFLQSKNLILPTSSQWLAPSHKYWFQAGIYREVQSDQIPDARDGNGFQNVHFIWPLDVASGLKEFYQVW
jgi:hypothetical protein